MRLNAFITRLAFYNRTLLISAGVGLLYLFLSASWILYSDRLAAELAASHEQLLLLQQYKGIGFVSLMAIFISCLVYKLHYRGTALRQSLSAMRSDSLTGLANRAVAEEFLVSQIQASARNERICGVILFDIRGLSRVNRSAGRLGGDLLLKEAGRRINNVLRQTDLVARYESDRFLVILSELSGPGAALKAGKRIQQAFDQPVLINGVEVEVELCGGVALVPKDGMTPAALLDAAERALYRNKQNGPGLNLAKSEDFRTDSGCLEREAQLRRAIREQQFTIALQPQVDLNTFELVGAEALARWQLPNGDQIPPNQFIPLAESLGLVQEITNQILALVGHSAAEWKGKERRPIQLCVNLSGLDLKSGRILKAVDSFLEYSQLPAHLLTLEITESWLMEDPHLALGLVHRLRAMGPQIAIDDFGTGFSALSQLIDFPFDYVKFDRSFVSGADKSAKKAQLLMAIQRMASTLGAKTIAEGVETMEELLLLEELGINEAQGFLFSKPIYAEPFESKFLDPHFSPFKDFKCKLEKLSTQSHSRTTPISRACS